MVEEKKCDNLSHKVEYNPKIKNKQIWEDFRAGKIFSKRTKNISGGSFGKPKNTRPINQMKKKSTSTILGKKETRPVRFIDKVKKALHIKSKRAPLTIKNIQRRKV